MKTLSEGSLLRILKGEASNKTVLQVLDHHSVTEGVIVEVSDGWYWTLAVLQASPLLDMMTAEQLHTHTVVDVQEYTLTVLSCAHGEKWHILELLALEVVKVPSCKKLGDPVRLLLPPNGLKGVLVPNPFSGNSEWSDVAESTQTISPIESLNLISSLKSVICARVLSKSVLRSWKKPGQEGNFFSMVLSDNTASIQATVFGKVCPAFYKLMEEGGDYYIHHYLVKAAHNQYARNLHAYELNFIEKTTVCAFVKEERLLEYSGARVSPSGTDSSANFKPIKSNTVEVEGQAVAQNVDEVMDWESDDCIQWHDIFQAADLVVTCSKTDDVKMKTTSTKQSLAPDLVQSCSKTDDLEMKTTSTTTIMHSLLWKNNSQGASWKKVVRMRQDLKSTLSQFQEVVEFAKNALSSEREIVEEYENGIEEANWKFSCRDPRQCFVFKSMKELLSWRGLDDAPRFVYCVGFINRHDPDGRSGLWLSSVDESQGPNFMPLELPALNTLLQVPVDSSCALVYGRPIMYPPSYIVRLRVNFIREFPVSSVKRYREAVARRDSLMTL